MVSGAGLGGLVATLMPLIGIASILYARRQRRSDHSESANDAFAKRQEAARESERRMAAYLAQHEPARYDTDMGRTEQEIKR